jgi:hypothetical protein
LDVVGNNLANLNTTGFKSDSILFKDIMGQTSGSTVIGAGVATTGTSKQFTQGSIQPTAGPLTPPLKATDCSCSEARPARRSTRGPAALSSMEPGLGHRYRRESSGWSGQRSTQHQRKHRRYFHHGDRLSISYATTKMTLSANWTRPPRRAPSLRRRFRWWIRSASRMC